ncbi:MAG: hypothetical protein AB7V13_17985 [Pseudorhodoplanes sp.]|uniref:hypothetical protein n=1 Tax=Pseudorhodoplanes sp. TaxID=1934341 RepID=UPI003D1418ED
MLSPLSGIAALAFILLPHVALAQTTHGAAAAGIQKRGSTSHVSIGTGGGSSPEIARKNAMESCMKGEPRNFPCRIVSNWQFGGCGFIATGTGRKNSGLVGWGSGATREAARAKCLSAKGIVSCDKVIGFCSKTKAEADAENKRLETLEKMQKELEEELEELEELEKELDEAIKKGKRS